MTTIAIQARAERSKVIGAGIPIKRVETIPVALPLRRPLFSAAGHREHARSLLVRIEAAGGVVGWGEAGEGPVMTGDTLASMRTAIDEYLAPLLIGQHALARGALVRRCREAIFGNPGAKAAVEMALLDLAGNYLGVSALELLGGAVRDEVRPLRFVGTGSTETDIADALAHQAEGYGYMKIKAGAAPLSEDVQRVRELRGALGPEVDLCIDANMGWDVRSASRFVKQVEDCDLLYVEQPVRYDDLAGMSAVARASSVPLGADEGIHGATDVLAHHREAAAAGVSLKPCKAGGLAEVIRLAGVCEALGVSVHIASLIESSIATAAVLQVGCAVPKLDWGISLTNHYLAEDLVQTPLTLAGGVMKPTPAPGFGFEIDTAQVEKFRLA